MGQTDQLPPMAPDAERAVLAAVLSDPAALDVVRDWLRPEDMFASGNQAILRAAFRIDESGSSVDVVSVATSLRDSRKLEAVGGTTALAELAFDSPPASALESHCRAVADKSRLRRIIDAARTVTIEANSEITDVDGWSQRAEQLIFDAAEFNRDQAATEFVGEVIPQIITDMEARQRDPSVTSSQLVRLPWRGLGKLMGALMLSKVHVVAGRPGMGKSVYCSELCRQCAERGETGALYISLEMTKPELAARLLAAESNKNLAQILYSEPDRDIWNSVTTAQQELCGKPISVRYAPGANVPLVRSVIRREAARMQREMATPLRLVVVDYLQLLAGQRRIGDSRETEVSGLCRDLVAIAGEFAVAIIAVSQLNRSLESRPNKRPQLSDLRESGAIEQDAYSVAFLYRDEYYDKDSSDAGLVEVNIAKHRNGRTGTVTLRFCKEYSLLRDLGNDDEDFFDNEDADRRYP